MKFSFSSSLEGERLRGFDGNDGQNMNMLMLDYFKFWVHEIMQSPDFKFNHKGLVFFFFLENQLCKCLLFVIMYNKIEGIMRGVAKGARQEKIY